MAQIASPEGITGGDGASMVLIPAGEFLMGTTDDDDMGYTIEFRKEKHEPCAVAIFSVQSFTAV